MDSSTDEVERSGLRIGLFAIFTLSGFAGLMYEAVWGRYLRLFLGHSAHAQTFVIAIFMGGMAIGAWLCSRYSNGWVSLLKSYAWTEIVIGIFALCFQTLFEVATHWAYESVMPTLQSSTAVYVFKQSFALALILPPSILLGMTFPLMTGGVIRLFPKTSGESLSMLYFTNSIGAAAGVLFTGFFLISWVGLPGTMLLAGLLNLVIGFTMLMIAKNAPEPELNLSESVGAEEALPEGRPMLLLIVALLTGVASFIYEIAWIRMLSMILGSTSHAFEIMLATFIAGLAFGGLWVKQRIQKLEDPVAFLGKVQWVMGLLALATIFVYNHTFDGMRALMAALARSEEGYVLFNVGSNLLAILVMFPAAFCAGTTLPLITYSLLRGGYGEKSIGQVYAFNTVGAITGVFFATYVGLPTMGLKGMIFFGAWIDIALGLVLIWGVAKRWRPVLSTVILGCTIALSIMALLVQFDPAKMASGVFRTGKLYKPGSVNSLYHQDGRTASIDVISLKTIVIMTNGKPDASLTLDVTNRPTADEANQTLSGVLPLAAYPDAKTAAVIGFGSGMTSAMLLASDTMERVDTIEIEEAMVEGAEFFRPRNEAVYTDPRSQIIYEDARTYFSAQDARYDIIMSEPSNPWVSGVATLFSEEFYWRVQKHLNENGLFTQWLQLYELEPQLLASVINALSKTFSDYALFSTDDSNILIMARRGGAVGALSESVFENDEVKEALWRHRITDINLLERYRIANRQALSPLFLSYDVPANSDYFPFLDAHTARSRFLRSSSAELGQIASYPVPVYDILGGYSRQAGTWTNGEYPPQLERQRISIRRVDEAIDAAHLMQVAEGKIQGVRGGISPTLLRFTRILRRQVIECENTGTPAPLLTSAIRTFGLAVTSHLDTATLRGLWETVQTSPCYQALPSAAKNWAELWRAAGQRDGVGLLAPAKRIYESDEPLSADDKEVVIVAVMVGQLAAGQPAEVLSLWDTQSRTLRDSKNALIYRLLMGHAHAQLRGQSAQVRQMK